MGGVGMFLSRRALISLNCIEKTQPKMMCVAFNGNSCTTIVSCYSPTSDESDITTFYDGPSSLVRHIPKLNVLILGGDMNA